MQRVTASPIPGRAGYRVQFRHPAPDVRVPPAATVSFGLDTREKEEADAIAADIQTILNDETFFHNPSDPRLLTLRLKAAAAFFGREHPAVKRMAELGTSDSPLTDADFKSIAAAVFRELPITSENDVEVIATGGISELAFYHLLRKYFGHYSPAKFKELQSAKKALTDQLATAKSKLEALQSEIDQLKVQYAVSVKVSIGDARDWWENQLDVAPKTRQEMTSAVDGFIASLTDGRDTPLVRIEPSDVLTYLNDLTVKDSDPPVKVSRVTRKKVRAYLSACFSAVCVNYGYARNPVKLAPLGKSRGKRAGVGAESKEVNHEITAIETESEIKTFIKALKPKPYWQALAAVFVFAGPRYSELVRMKVDDVNLERNEIKITATKTGRFRRVAIESTTLREILKDYLDGVRPTLRHRSTPYLFPSIADDNIYKPRTLTPAGMWSDNGVWWDYWRAEALPLLHAGAKYRDYGPLPWRHTAGTILGMLGWTASEIAAYLGNTEKVAAEFYVKKSSQGKGKRWSFKY